MGWARYDAVSCITGAPLDVFASWPGNAEITLMVDADSPPFSDFSDEKGAQLELLSPSKSDYAGSSREFAESLKFTQ